MPLDAAVPPNEPASRLAFYVGFSPVSPLAKRLTADVARLKQFRYPVTIKQVQGDDWSSSEVAEFAKWIDSLDRF